MVVGAHCRDPMKHTFHIITFILIGLLLSPLLSFDDVSAIGGTPESYESEYVNKPPEIDGKFTEDAWDEITTHSEELTPLGQQQDDVADRGLELQVVNDDENLYLSLKLNLEQ